MPLPELLERLLTTPGPSGQERAAAAVWREAAAPVGEVSSDVLGNSWVRVPGTAGGPSLALVGHIDEIAVVVTHLGDDGLAAVRPGSGWDPAVMVGQRVDVLARDGAVPGVVAVKQQKRKRGEGRKPVERDDLFLDVGAKDGDELRRLIRPGDNVVWHGAPLALQGNRVASRAFDNRMGCYVALESARRIAEGRRCARRRDRRGCGAGGGRRLRRLAHGRVLHRAGPRRRDRRDPHDRRARRRSRGRGQGRPRRRPDDLARPVDPRGRLRAAVRHRRGGGHPVRGRGLARGTTSTDADAIYLSRAGVATGVVSVPLRYMHSPIEMLDLDDLERAVQLVVAFARRLEPGMSFTG